MHNPGGTSPGCTVPYKTHVRSAAKRGSGIKLIAPVFVRASRVSCILYPVTRIYSALVPERSARPYRPVLRHEYVYLTSNTKASCYARIHTTPGNERERRSETVERSPPPRVPQDVASCKLGRRNRKFHFAPRDFSRWK